MADLTGEEKAALLLLSLDAQVAQSVLTQLGGDRKARLAGHMTRLGNSPQLKDAMAQVLQEAEEMLQQPKLRIAPSGETAAPVGKGPAPEPRPAQTPAPPRPVGARVNVVTADPEPRLSLVRPEEPAPAAAGIKADGDPLVELGRLDSDRLGVALEGESARTVALILSHLPSERAGAVFKQLGPEMRRDVSVQMGTCAMPGLEVVKRTARALLGKAQAVRTTSKEGKGPTRYKKMAELLRQLERMERQDAITALQERDPEAASQVKQNLYDFEDLLILDGRSIQKVLAEMDSHTLAVAMKGVSEDILQKVTENMSKRAREGLSEEMDFLGTQPTSQIRDARKAVVDVIQRLDQSGEIVMLR